MLAPLAHRAEAQFVDQSQLVANRFNLNPNRVGQTFKPGQNNIVGAAAFLHNPTGSVFTSALSVEVWAGGIANTVGATLIASGTQSFTLAAGASSWVSAFWSAVAVTPGTTYFLDFGGNGPTQFGYACCVSPAPNPIYPSGDLYRSNSPLTSATYRQTGEGDLAFQTYATPEPASVALLATGLLGVFGVARRRNSI